MKHFVNKYAYASIAAFILASTPSSFCVINNIAVYTDGQKTACIIGESHITFFEPEDPIAPFERRDTAHLLDLTKRASASSDPALFILETPDYESAITYAGELLTYLEPGAMFTLAKFAQERNKTIGHQQFFCADSRGPALYSFISFLGSPLELLKTNAYASWLMKTCMQLNVPPIFIRRGKTSLKLLDQLLIESPQLRQKFFSKCPILKDFFNPKLPEKKHAYSLTIYDLFNELQRAIKNLNDTLESTDKNSPLYQSLITYKDPLKNAINDVDTFCKNVIGVENYRKSIGDCMLNVFSTKLFKFVKAEYKKFKAPLVAVTDIDFLITVNDGLKKANKIIFFGGSHHCERLKTYFDQSHFRQVLNVKIRSSANAEGNSFSLLSDDAVKKSFLDAEKLLGLLPESTNSKTGVNQIFECCVCHNTFDKLFHCGRCKKTRYCSVACQKSDWAQHKQLCKPV